MEQPSVTYSDTQSIDYLGQSHNWTNTDIISPYKKICKQLYICQEKLQIQKGQRKFKRSYSQLSQKAVQQAQQSQRERNVNVATIGHIGNTLKQQKEEPALCTEERHLIRMKNALWRRMGPSVGCVGKGNKLVSPKTLKCSFQYQRKDIYSEQQEKCLTNVIQTYSSSSSYVPRYDRSLKNRRIQRKIRHASKIDSYTNYFMQLPRQNISNNPFANQIFNGINFY
ncbi:unnamed protein product [Rhizophagus irregularis]|uniref:Uncharacterized protein n=1 Tax=Rhizophagus irregularis TaxID=588596 RepID=A0A2I1GAR1_9GLOM|nr:hypothetical protein RhiirA4_541312 [Rhizophagus irregularis]CAB4427115.1 unnamed protein product [Rhizophagus irregularis]CAB4427285.1 unnamed protein product [Rhizophagus irregularis]